MLKRGVDLVVLVWYTIVQVVLNFVFAGLFLLKSSLSLVPRGFDAILGIASFYFARLVEFAWTLLNTVKTVISIPLTFACFCIRVAKQVVNAFKTSCVVLVRTCFSSLKTISDRLFEVLGSCTQLFKAGSYSVLGVFTTITASALIGIKLLVNVVIGATNLALSLVLIVFHIACGVYRLICNVANRCSKVLRRLSVVCFQDLKTGRNSEILQTSVTCYQVLKTGALAVVYALVLCYHVAKTVACEMTRYFMACVISGAGSVHVVKTKACVMSDSAFCNHSH